METLVSRVEAHHRWSCVMCEDVSLQNHTAQHCAAVETARVLEILLGTRGQLNSFRIGTLCHALAVHGRARKDFNRRSSRRSFDGAFVGG